MAYTLKEIDEHINYWKRVIGGLVVDSDLDEDYVSRNIEHSKKMIKMWEHIRETQTKEQES